MGKGFFGNAGGEVGDHGDPEDPHPGVAGGDDLGHGGHAHKIRAQGPESPDLRRRLVGWTRRHDVNPFLHGDPKLSGNLARKLPKPGS